MAAVSDQPERAQLEVQRVPARTRGALAVGVALTLLVGLLIAKPWDTRPTTIPDVAILRPTPTLTASATAEAIQASPSAPATPQPPSPSVPPRGRPPPSSPKPPDVYTVFLSTASANAICRYERAGHGQRRLASIEVVPPVAYAALDFGTGHVHSAVWSFEVIVNRAESVFDAEWEAVAESGREVAPAADGQPANFSPQTVQLDASEFGPTATYGPTAIFRARLVVVWYTLSTDPNMTVLTATRYLDTSPRTIGPTVPYCPGIQQG
jgi:hypothetical protein